MSTGFTNRSLSHSRLSANERPANSMSTNQSSHGSPSANQRSSRLPVSQSALTRLPVSQSALTWLPRDRRGGALLSGGAVDRVHVDGATVGARPQGAHRRLTWETGHRQRSDTARPRTEDTHRGHGLTWETGRRQRSQWSGTGQMLWKRVKRSNRCGGQTQRSTGGSIATTWRRIYKKPINIPFWICLDIRVL